MYFETGQGSALSANAHHGVDQQTLEARAYAVARQFKPLLVNTVVGFIGPEYLFDGKQITRAGLEDHFCGKLLGVPMGVDVCYTNHAEADQDDMDALLTLLVAAGVNFVMGVPGADDIMLGYQSTSFHDALVMRDLFGKRPAPEFEAWLDAARFYGWCQSREAARFAEPLPRAADGDDMADRPIDTWASLRRSRRRASGWRAAARRWRPRRCLEFKLAHARARDAVHEPLDQARLVADLESLGVPVRAAASAAEDRQTYLMRPDLGRSLAPRSATALAEDAGQYDVAIVIADGLSARAVQLHACPVLAELLPKLRGVRIAPLVVVRHGRVAIGDTIASLLGADCAAVLIGERPGLTAPDSMGAYLTWQPGPQTTDAARNCVSNIRPDGIGYAEAAAKLAYLLGAIRARRLSGVQLKDEQDALLSSSPART